MSLTETQGGSYMSGGSVRSSDSPVLPARICSASSQYVLAMACVAWFWQRHAPWQSRLPALIAGRGFSVLSATQELAELNGLDFKLEALRHRQQLIFFHCLARSENGVGGTSHDTRTIIRVG